MPLFEKRDISLLSPPEWLVEAYGLPTYAEENVTVERAVTIPAVLAAITILAQDTASLPLILYRRLTRGKERATDHPLYTLVHDAPNPEMTSMVFRELVISHMIGWGDFFGQLIWDTRGRVREIWPLNPANMEVGRKNGQRIYLYTNSDGRRIPFTQDDILHIPAFGFDGMRGKSLIALSRNAIAGGMAAERYSSRVYANDARPSVVLTTQTSLKDDQIATLRESWEQAYRGADNAGKAAVLPVGMDLKTIGFPPKDAQFIEAKSWTVQEMSRVFRIPPHMLGDVERSTSWGSGIEQQQLSYVTHTLRPWTVRIEGYLNRSLLLERERPGYFFEHLFDDLLRTDTKTRMEAYALGITNGILTRNEVREMENRLPYEGGDEPLYPLNMTTGIDGEGPSNDVKEPPQDEEDDMPQRDITPLLMDAARRISKRDENELNGAIKRYEGKPEKWTAWVEQFYKRDYPAFILATLQPLTDARILRNETVSRLTATLCEQRGAEVTAEKYDTLDTSAILELLKEASHV